MTATLSRVEAFHHQVQSGVSVYERELRAHQGLCMLAACHATAPHNSTHTERLLSYHTIHHHHHHHHHHHQVQSGVSVYERELQAHQGLCTLAACHATELITLHTQTLLSYHTVHHHHHHHHHHCFTLSLHAISRNCSTNRSHSPDSFHRRGKISSITRRQFFILVFI